ncbi:MAG: matrixin family metalloprotease [Nocardioides sp.]
MDGESSPPTAAELGISEAEYERILRGLDGRRSVAGVPVSPVGTEARATSGSEPTVPRVAFKTLVLALLVPVTLILSLLVSDSGGDDAPEHAFIAMAGDHPVAYTSCRPIQVAVYPAGGPPGAVDLVRDAVARAASASGLELVVIGPFGGAAPNWNFEAAPVHRDDPISVSWQDGGAIAELTDHTAGLGGSRVIDYPDGRRRLVAGTIALSIDYYRSLDESGDRAEQLAVLLHEIGHVLGLAHVDNPGELMNEDNLGLTTYGPGDLEGLRRLGRGPCF